MLRAQIHEPVSGRQTTEEYDAIDCVERASTAFRAASEDIGGPIAGPTARLASVMRDVVRLRERGFSATRLRLVAFALMAVVDDVEGPVTPEMEEIVARHESRNDAAEQMKQDERVICGDSPFRLEEHARALELDAASSLTYARVLRHKARRLRTEREIERKVTIDRLTGNA